MARIQQDLELDDESEFEDDTETEIENRIVRRYSVSQITQGAHRFYTLSMPSDVLARTCMVTSRKEDPKLGFQRTLDKDRAREIAIYIDEHNGTIPNSIVLSAQPEANLSIIGKGKTLQFTETQRAFFILDGQHRVYGFSIAKTMLRVPVVIYNNLTRRDESRLFIDINTKQRPVPNELLLDIKNLAEYETTEEELLRFLFDSFAEDSDSPLLGKMSHAERKSGRISRVTFNAGTKPLISNFTASEPENIYIALSSFVRAFMIAYSNVGLENLMMNPIAFRATMAVFPDVAQRVQDKYGKAYTTENFREVVDYLVGNMNLTKLRSPSNSYKSLAQDMVKALRSKFTL